MGMLGVIELGAYSCDYYILLMPVLAIAWCYILVLTAFMGANGGVLMGWLGIVSTLATAGRHDSHRK